jgi:HEAT repeat protein
MSSTFTTLKIDLRQGAATTLFVMLVGCGGSGSDGAFHDGRHHFDSGERAMESPGTSQRSADSVQTDEAAYAGFRLDLVDADPIVRADAIWALAELKSDREATDLLSATAMDPDPFVRVEVMDALVYVGDESDLDLLAYALEDPRAIVREAAVEALRSIGGPRSVLVLAAAVNDPDVTVREEVIYALRHVGGPDSAALLEEMLVDPDLEIRELARAALARSRLAGG